MNILSETSKVGGWMAGALPLVGAGPSFAEVGQTLAVAVPYADSAFGMALPAAAFTMAVAGGAAMRAARWFLSAAPLEGASTPYVRGTWENMREVPAVAQPKPQAVAPSSAVAKPLKSPDEPKIDPDLAIICDTVKDPGKFFDQVEKWLRQRDGISDADFYHILSKMPRGSGWSWESGGSKEFHADMARDGLTDYNNKSRFHCDMQILFLAVFRIKTFYYPNHVDEIYTRIKAFLPTSLTWRNESHDGYKADVTRYYYHEVERLKRYAAGSSSDAVPPVPQPSANPPKAVAAMSSADAVAHLKTLAKNPEAAKKFAGEYLRAHEDLSILDSLQVVNLGFYADAKAYAAKGDAERFQKQWGAAVESAKAANVGVPEKSVLPPTPFDGETELLFGPKLVRLNADAVLSARLGLSEPFADYVTQQVFALLMTSGKLNAVDFAKLVGTVKNATVAESMIVSYYANGLRRNTAKNHAEGMVDEFLRDEMSVLTPAEAAQMLIDLRGSRSNALLNHLTLDLLAKNAGDVNADTAAQLIGKLSAEGFKGEVEEWNVFIKRSVEVYLAGRQDFPEIDAKKIMDAAAAQTRAVG